MLVPTAIPTADGRLHVAGWHVQPLLEGRRPDGSTRDEALLRAALDLVHSITAGWPQRPGSRSARELLTADRGADVDLRRVPEQVRQAIREAWAAVDPVDRCVVHGDAGGGNVLIQAGGGCVLIDWDEARVDDPLFDLPDPAESHHARAALAWEIATCWQAEPAYARSLVPQLMG